MSKRISLSIALTFATMVSGCTTSGSSLFSFGKSDSEYDLARKSLKDPDAVLGAYANWKADVGQVTEARRSYNTLLEENPDSVSSLLGLAAVEEKAGRLVQAEKKFMEAVDRNPESALAKHAAGSFFSRHDRTQTAIDLLSRAVSDEPEDSRMRYELGVALTKAGKISEGMSHLSITVGEAEASYNVGYLLSEMGRKQEALPYLQRAVQMKPTLVQAKTLLSSLANGASESYTPVVQSPVRPQMQMQAQMQQVRTSNVNTQAANVMVARSQQYQNNVPAPANGYRPPTAAIPASAQPTSMPVMTPQMTPAMRQPTMQSLPQASYNGPQPGVAPGLPKLNIPQRRQIQNTIRQASGTYATPSINLTPAQLQKMMQATR